MSSGPESEGKKGRPRDPKVSIYDLIDEAARAGRLNLGTSPRETPKERESRLEEERKDADLDRWKEKIYVVFTISLLSLVVAGCAMILASPSRPESEKKWAMSALALIVGGAVTRTYGRDKG